MGTSVELATVYHPRNDDLPEERKVATLGVYDEEFDFFDLKGDLEVVLESLGSITGLSRAISTLPTTQASVQKCTQDQTNWRIWPGSPCCNR